MNNKNGRKENYISRHFIISAVVIVALLIVIPFITVYLLTQAYDEQIRNETTQRSKAITQNVRSFVDGAYTLCYELAVNPSILEMDGEVQARILADCAERNDYIELLYITGMDGMQVARSTGTLGDRSGRWWFIQMMETRLPFVSRSYYSVSTGMPCTAIFIPMYAGQEMTAVFGADISLEYIQGITDQFTNFDSGYYSFIIDGEGVILAHPDSNVLETLTNYKTLIRTVPRLTPRGEVIYRPDGTVMTGQERITVSDGFKAVIDAVMDGESGLEIVENDGITYYMSYEPVALPGYSDSWSVITLQDRAAAMSVVSNLTLQVMLIIIVIFVIFIALIVHFFKSLRKTMTFLENAKLDAEQANKSKSNFLATMSHEIRTPMNAIIGITQTQLQKDDLSDEYVDVMDKIFTSGSALLRIINDILDLTKIETGKLELAPTEYDTPSLVNDTIQLNIVRIGEKKLDFKLEVEDTLPSKLFGDELRVKQILNNLLSNAIKYTKEGYVKLKIDHIPDGDEVILSFRIEDTGQGISPEDLEQLFDEYQRFNNVANRTTEGTGLGLSITKRLAEMMGGTIEVESEYGKGSVFIVTVRQKTVECTEIGSEVAESLRDFDYLDKSHIHTHIDYIKMPYGNVLVVDDVEINLYVAEAVLEPYGLHIELVDSGFAAISKIEDGHVYDVIFMDHMMPKMDGIATTEKLRESGYKGAIVALTANALVGNDVMFAEHGFDGFIPKPIDIYSIDEVLKKYVLK